MYRPDSIVYFERFFGASILVSVLATIITWNEITMEFERESAGIQSATALGFIIATFVVTLLILSALWYGIARRASNVAKWIYVVLTGLGTLLTIASLFEPTEFGGLSLAGSLLSTALSVASIVCLFRADAIAWLTGKGPTDPSVFE